MLKTIRDEENNSLKVSIIIPCRNEEKFIGTCLDSIIDQDYPKENLEVLVVDGMSKDVTKKIIEDYSHRYPFIKYLENPKKITPCALNIGINSATGEIIVRMDAHAKYERAYISKCVKYLNYYNVDNVGGNMVTLPIEDSLIGRSIVKVLTNKFGVGNSAFRTGSKEPKFVDTVFGGCYWKEIFDKIGLFNENLSSSQDIEFNLRLIRSGGKILLVPDIISYYYTRSNLISFITNNFRNGFWVVYPLKFVKMPLSWRHYIPFAFVSILLGSALLTFYWLIFGYLLLFTSGLYLLTNAFFSAEVAVSEKNWRYFFIIILTFTVFHLSYGFGSMVGLVKVLFSKNFWSIHFRKK